MFKLTYDLLVSVQSQNEE